MRNGRCIMSKKKLNFFHPPRSQYFIGDALPGIPANCKFFAFFDRVVLNYLVAENFIDF